MGRRCCSEAEGCEVNSVNLLDFFLVQIMSRIENKAGKIAGATSINTEAQLHTRASLAHRCSFYLVSAENNLPP